MNLDCGAAIAWIRGSEILRDARANRSFARAVIGLRVSHS